MARTTSVSWAKSVLKHCDAVLSKISVNITYNCKTEICNALIYLSMKLLPSDLVMRAAKKLNWVFTMNCSEDFSPLGEDLLNLHNRGRSGCKVH